MMHLFHSPSENLYRQSNYVLLFGDALEELKKIQSQSIDLIFADPPYFLSGNGLTFNSGKIISVNKGDWDKAQSISKINSFNAKWLKESFRILKPSGTIWITGTHHNIYSVGMTLQKLNFRILNHITWVKKNPPPNFSHKYFNFSTEFIIWAKKNNDFPHYFNYELMKYCNYGKQMTDVWYFDRASKEEKIYGKHPTQKPLKLLERIILASSKPHQIVLDPFTGSSTTGVAALKHKRFFIGIEKEKVYFDLSIRRLNSIKH